MDSSKIKLPKIPSHQAAQELRQSIKDALNYVKDSGGVVTNNQKRWTNIQRKVMDRNKERLGYATQVDQTYLELDNAIRNRRARAGLEALSVLRNRLAYERKWANQVAEAVLGLPSYHFGIEGQDSNGYLVPMVTLERWNILIQCIPTQPEMPADQKDMVIRAIVAILRANNVEGIAGVTQVMKNIEKEQKINVTTEGSEPASEAA